MHDFKITIAFAPFSLLLAVPVQAMPDDAEELRTIVQTEFGGNALAYVEEKDGDFRRMACRGRADLIETLINEGLVLTDISGETYSNAAYCSYREKELDTMRLLFTPDYISGFEDANFGGSYMGPLY